MHAKLLRSRGGVRARRMAGIKQNPRPPLSMPMQQTPAEAPLRHEGGLIAHLPLLVVPFFDCMPGDSFNGAPALQAAAAGGPRSIFLPCA